jgi:UDP-perosamine 4-acetyltransferase
VTRFLIWGGGGHGKVVADLIRAVGHTVAGFCDADPAKLNRVVEPGGAAVIISESELLGRVEGRELPVGVDAVALAIGDNRTRLRCLQLLSGLSVPPLVHPSAVVSPSARVGDGSVVFACAVINAAAAVGRAVIVNSGAIVEHDCEVGDGVHLSPRSTLGGGVRVEERCWIGAGATVLQLIKVGAEAMVGAGATVIRDIPAGITVAGVPAKPIRSREVQ